MNNKQKSTRYLDKFKDPRWQKKRLQLLELHNWKCDDCNNTENELHVHHRFYIKGREPWEYDNDVFQVLCSDCHSMKHKKINNKHYLKLINLIEDNDIEFDLITELEGIIESCIANNYVGFLGLLNKIFNDPYIEKIKQDIEDYWDSKINEYKENGQTN
jgi:hypothetical protein